MDLEHAPEALAQLRPTGRSRASSAVEQRAERDRNDHGRGDAFAAAAVAVASPWRLGLIAAPVAIIILETIAFFGGAVNSGLGVGYASLSIELAPPGERQAFVSLCNTFLGPTMLLPMAGGALLDATSAPVVFTLCGVLALWGAHAASRLPRPHEIAAARLPGAAGC